MAEQLEEARQWLAQKDKALGKLIAKVGACKLQIDELQSPFEALAESIVYQQLTGKAAATIFGRVKKLCGDEILEPEHLLQLRIEDLRGAGCSQAKALALKDLAAKAREGIVPGLNELSQMSDEAIIERLIVVRGVGRWTVEMLLIFRLGRLDVLPVNDYGVRKGFARTFRLGDLPSPKEMIARGERWRPFRSVASWYMWRALELPQ